MRLFLRHLPLFHLTDIYRIVIPHCSITVPAYVFQNNSVDQTIIFFLPHIFRCITQLIIQSGRRRLCHSHIDSGTFFILIPEQIYFQSLCVFFHPESFSVYMDHTLFHILFYFYEAYIPHLLLLFVFIQISNKPSQNTHSCLRLFITIYSEIFSFMP